MLTRALGWHADCEYANGDEFAATYNWYWEHRGRDIGIFLCYVVVRLSLSAFLSLARLFSAGRVADMSADGAVQRTGYGRGIALPPLRKAVDRLSPLTSFVPHRCPPRISYIHRSSFTPQECID